TNKPANPYVLWSFLMRSSASGPAYFSIRCKNALAPKRRPSVYVTIAPARLPIQPRKKTVNGDPCARSARKLPKAITASEGNGGKKFSNADSAAIATYNDPSGRSPSQSVIE